MSERNLRDLLADAAADIPAFAPAPEVVLPRARRRAAFSVGLSALVVILVVSLSLPLLSELADLADERPASGPIQRYPIGSSAMPMETMAAYGSVWTLEQSPLGDGMGWRTELVGRRIDSGEVWVRRSLGEDASGQWVQLRAGFGAVWALSPTRHEITKVDPTTGQLVWQREIPARAFDVGSGGLWTITSAGQAMQFGAIEGLEPVDIVDVGDTPIAITATRDAIWVADDFDGIIRRIDSGSDEIVAEIRTGTNLTGDIIANSRGAWTIGCRPVDGSRDPTVRPDACDLVLITIDPFTDTVAGMTRLAGPSAASMTNAHWAFVESVDAAGVWVVVSEAACSASPFAPCDGDVLLRFAHDGASLLDRTDGMVITDATTADGDLWIANVGETHEIVRWQP